MHSVNDVDEELSCWPLAFKPSIRQIQSDSCVFLEKLGKAGHRKLVPLWEVDSADLVQPESHLLASEELLHELAIHMVVFVHIAFV